MSQRGKYRILTQTVLGLSMAALGRAQSESIPAAQVPARPETSADGEHVLRLAVVDVQKLFREYYKTDEAQKQLNAQRALLAKRLNERKEQNSQYHREYNKRLEKARNPQTPVEEKVRLEGELKKLGDALQENEQRLAQAYENQSKQLDRKMEFKMEGILAEIHSLAKIHAKKADFDMVIDISGTDTNLVPMLIYARDSEDITDSLLKELNKNAPAQR